MNYKLYKVTVEKVFVLAAPIEDSIDTVENSVMEVMRVHSNDMRSEAPTHIIAEEISSVRDLPDEWVPGCLPYTQHSPAKMPLELVNKTIKEYLDATHKTNTEELQDASFCDV
jgi:hypothetical protein